MIDVASLELCRELFDLSGWDEQDNYWVHDTYDVNPRPDFVSITAGNGSFKTIASAYSLGYLLRKLPRYPSTARNHIKTGPLKLTNSDYGWYCGWSELIWNVNADTPENAACQLAIELIKAGVMNPKSQPEEER